MGFASGDLLKVCGFPHFRAEFFFKLGLEIQSLWFQNFNFTYIIQLSCVKCYPSTPRPGIKVKRYSKIYQPCLSLIVATFLVLGVLSGCDIAKEIQLKKIPRPANLPFTWEWESVDRLYFRQFYFLDSENGWAIGEENGDSIILTTEDGGNSWKDQKVIKDSFFMSMQFLNDKLGWVAGNQGNDGVIYATTDGGATWNSIYSEKRNYLEKIHFINEEVGWALTRKGILSTTDGGTTWNSQDVGAKKELNDIHFIDETQGWAVSESEIFHTKDGGATWKQQRSGVKQGLGDVYFLNAKTGWVIGNYFEGYLYTENGGATWKRQTFDEKISFDTIQFIDGQSGFMIGALEGQGLQLFIFKTTNGGETWKPQKLDVDEYVRQAFFFDKQNGILSGNGDLFSTKDGGKSVAKIMDTPHGDLSSVQFVNDQEGWAVSSRFGRKRLLIFTKDGGKTWVKQPLDTEESIDAIQFVNEKIGWVWGSRFIFRTQTGGLTWEKSLPPDDSRFFDIDFVDSQIGWATAYSQKGRGGNILQTKNGGRTWEEQLIFPDVTLWNLQFLNPKIGWVAGYNHKKRAAYLYSTKDAGETWDAKNMGEDELIYGPKFFNEKNGVLATSKAVLTTVDGGATWKEQPVGSGRSVRYMYFLNELTGFATVNEKVKAGFRGKFKDAMIDQKKYLVTTNGGVTWREENRVTFNTVYHKGNQIWLGGDFLSLTKSKNPSDFPYVNSFGLAEQLNKINIQFTVEAKEVDFNQLKIAGIQFSQESPTAEIQSIDLKKYPLVERSPGVYQFVWNPQDEKYNVDKNSTLYYQITMEAWKHALPVQKIPFPHVYKPWWVEIYNQYKEVLWVAGLLSAYFGMLYLLLYVYPLFFINLGGGRWFQYLKKDAPRILRGLFSITTLPYFSDHERVRKSWIQSVKEGDSAFAHLPSRVYQDFIQFPDCLDLWIDLHKDILEAALKRTDLYKKSQGYMELPVRLDHPVGGELFKEPQPQSFQPLFRGARCVVSIVGEGGTGKTMLVSRLAQMAFASKVEERLMPHRSIPVALEGELDDLVESTSHILKEMLGVETIDLRLVEALLKRKRLLVIIDALSERSQDTQGYVTSLFEKGVPVNVLITTSRLMPDFGSTAVRYCWPEILDEGRVVKFIGDYLRSKDSYSEFKGRPTVNLAERVLTVVESGGERLSVTPLLLKWYLENAISRVQSTGSLKAIETLPLSIPEIILEYLRGINPEDNGTESEISEELLIEGAQILAHCSLGDNCIPKDFRRDVTEQEFTNHPRFEQSAQMIDRFIANGILAQRTTGDTQFLRFTFNPMAEYLGAMYSIKTSLPGQPEQWNQWVGSLQDLEGYPRNIKGFLVALEECCRIYQNDYNIPLLFLDVGNQPKTG